MQLNNNRTSITFNRIFDADEVEVSNAGIANSVFLFKEFVIDLKWEDANLNEY